VGYAIGYIWLIICTLAVYDQAKIMRRPEDAQKNIDAAMWLTGIIISTAILHIGLLCRITYQLSKTRVEESNEQV